MKLSIAVLLVVLMPFVSQAQSDPLLKNYYEQVRKQFDENNAYKTVAFVEQRWRIAGNKGFDESIFYVEDILKKAGYVNESKATANDRLTYRIEKRPMKRLAWEPVDAVVEIAGEKEPLLSFKTNRNMLAINSGSTAPGGLEVEVVYVPKATKDELDKVDLKNKVLFAEQGIGQVHRAAVGRGAAGALGYSVAGYTQPQKHIHSIQFSSIAYTDSTAGTFGILLSTYARNRLKEALAKGPVKLRIKTVTKMYAAEELTLVADVKGENKPEERFVFSAHVQEPGANDNATGVGTLAEMARVTAAMIAKKQFTPQRSITFLWGDEIVSTKRYVTEDAARAKNIQWGMSLDMVGEDVSKTGGTFLIEKMPDPSAVWTRGEEKHSEWGGRPLPESAIVPHYFNDYMLSRCLDQAKTNGWVVKTNPFEGGSDHTPFLEASIPGLLMWHFTDVFYHTDADRLENVSPQEMKNVGISALVSAMALTGNNEQTALYLVNEYRESAFKRLATEHALSMDVVTKDAGKKTSEVHIIETWGKFYQDALSKMSNLQPGGNSGKISAAIEQAKQDVAARTAALVKELNR
ncbi:M28 family peptidase [Sediminibacterium ginsengisoli]|uniref:Peptidase family M28 n=1 Tax=Sediminibacterium ginsengisoli TaxID=413434 RepID=A0A1T4RBL5_9BACT|nr:M28 family peptidase [Sediminibacterium ginsengisoli]SKA13440.1 Peptidase family M28 [Sediminibacterium ginsengisoli]